MNSGLTFKYLGLGLFYFGLFVVFVAFFFFKKPKNPGFRVPFLFPKEATQPLGAWTRRILRSMAIAFLGLALMRPQIANKQTIRNTNGVDIQIVLDLSASMNVEDLEGGNRLDVARETIRSFIRGRPTDRFGLTVFSGEPLTLVPPTFDSGVVLFELDKLEAGMLKDGTAIGDGLSTAVLRLKASTAKSRIAILLTDGESNIGQVDPLTAGELAKGYGIRVYTIAVGREGRVRVPVRRKGIFGKTVTTYQEFDNALNTDLLEKIAAMTQGKFYRVTDQSALKRCFEDIDRLERTKITVKERVQYEEKFLIFLKLAVVCIILDFVLTVFMWRSLG